MRKKLLLIATGGTIASVENGNGLSPGVDALSLIGLVPELKNVGDITALPVLNTDSSNMQPEDWVTIAKCVIEHEGDFDGIVITHGTDTMAYTSSALSYMLCGIDKPVILTGSQLPIGANGSDAPKNLLDAFKTACSEELRGVFVVFAGRIIRGCRAVKFSSSAIDAFRSVNSADVGRVDKNSVTVNTKILKNRAVKQYMPVVDNRVFLAKLVSGFDPKVLSMAALMDYRAVIIEGFGAGGVPVSGRSILPELKMLNEKGITAVVTTQCVDGACDMTVYEVGRRALESGALSSGDITLEALVTKMMWILGQTDSQEEIKRLLFTDICGEISAHSRDGIY